MQSVRQIRLEPVRGTGKISSISKRKRISLERDRGRICGKKAQRYNPHRICPIGKSSEISNYARHVAPYSRRSVTIHRPLPTAWVSRYFEQQAARGGVPKSHNRCSNVSGRPNPEIKFQQATMKDSARIPVGLALAMSSILFISSIQPSFARNKLPDSAGSIASKTKKGIPGPIAGAGLPIFAIGYGAYWLIRRRRNRSM